MAHETVDGFYATRLILAIPINLEQKLRKKLNSLCHTSWQNDDQIKVLAFQLYRDSTNIAAILAKEIKSAEADHFEGRVIFVDQLKLDGAAIKNLKKLDPSIRKVCQKELQRGILLSELKALGLTWQERVVKKLGKGWARGGITRDSIRSWCDQFDRLNGDSHRWVGEALLKGITIYPADQMASLFLKSSTAVSTVNCTYSTVRYKIGNSADVLSNLIQKKFSEHLHTEIEIVNWLDLIKCPQKGINNCLVFEDGLFTGTEMADVLHTLAGDTQNPKKGVDPLSNPDFLKQIPAKFIFVIATDVGLVKLTDAIEKTGANIKIIYSNLIKTLTDTGSAKLAEGMLYCSDQNDRQYVAPQEEFQHLGVFDDCELFPNEKKGKAVDLCRKLGKPLWASYLARKNKEWSNELIDYCALGAGNMALAIVFAYSVPKSSLPVFWCSGQIQDKNGRPFDWVPLFRDAHPI